MKLTHVSVEGCGRFGTLTRVENFGPGVNILSARNEAGKSTLFRAIRTCLFERHHSVNKDIQALATEGLSLPVTISVGFEQDGDQYEIRKSFLRGKSASLLRNGVERSRNQEADEEVWKLLGIEPKSTRALDEAAYGMLWVQQGRSFEMPKPSEAAASVLNSVIQQEVGTLVGGERARAVLAALDGELEKLVTGSTRKPRANGPLDMAQKDSARLRDEHMAAERRLAELNGKIDDLARLRADLKSAADAATLQTFRGELAEAERKLAEAQKAGEEIKRLAGEERQAHAWAEAQQEKVKALRERAAAIDAHRMRLKELAIALTPLDAEEASLQQSLDEARAEKQALETEAEKLDAREAELQRLAAVLAKLAAREAMAARLDRLRDFRARAAQNEAALKAATVNDAALRALEALEQEEANSRARLEAGAARLAIESRGGTAVQINGEALPLGPTARAVTEPLVIRVGDDVSITVTPPAAARAAAEQALEEQRRKLQALLARHGAATPAGLRRLRAERITLEEQARDLRAEAAALTMKDEPVREIERLETAIAEIDAAARHILHPDTPPPDAEEIEGEKQRLSEARGAQRVARAGIEARIASHGASLTALASRCGTLTGQIQEIHARLDTELALLPDENRETLLAEAEKELEARRDAHRLKATVLAARQAQAPAEGEAERWQARVDRFSSAIQSREDEANALRQRIAHLEGEIQAAGGDGLGERVATLKLQQEMAMAEAQHQEERAAMLFHLRTTVDQCYARRREQLNEPLRRHLRPFLNDVFPEAEVALGENFSVAGLSRSNPGSELFGRLSLGTQEQVAVLVRLAMGAMICERGEDVPIILDDALVFSDDARIEQMFDAISRAGRNQQVIVLTCRARSFASLGGRQLRIV